MNAFGDDNAACRTDGSAQSVEAMSHLFLAPPNERRGPALQRRAQAVAICDRCPVIESCLAWAIDNPVLIGDHTYRPTTTTARASRSTVGDIWGGTTVHERWAIRRQHGGRARAPSLGPIPHGTTEGFRRHLRTGSVPCRECAAAAAGHDAVRLAHA